MNSTELRSDSNGDGRDPKLGHCEGYLNAFKHRISRALLLFFSQFCQVDVGRTSRTSQPSQDDDDDDSWRVRGTIEVSDEAVISLNSSIQHEEPEQKDKNRPWWPQLILGLYVICQIRLSVALYLQYNYDYYRLKWETFEQSDDATREQLFIGPEASHGNLSMVRQQILEDLARHKASLVSWGAPFMNADVYALEAPMLLLMVLTFAPYIMTRIYFNNFDQINLFFINLMLDEPRERAHMQSLIEAEMRTIENSSRNYLQAHLALMDDIDLSEINRHAMETCELVDYTQQQRLVDELEEEHRQTVQLLRELNKFNQFQPINRSVPWIDRMSTDFNTSSIGNLIYSFIFDISLLYLAPKFYLNFHYETRPLDQLLVADICILTGISVVATTFYLALYVANATDQGRLVDQTSAQLDDCIKSNIGIQHDQLQPIKLRRRHINSNLLLAIMRYKLFLRQFKPVQRTFVFATHTAFSMILFLPTIITIHSPYMTPSVRPVSLYFTIIIMIFSNFFLVPVAQFHHKAMHLYRKLWSLAAHLAAAFDKCPLTPVSGGQQQQQGQFQLAYFRHTRWLMVKELSHPEALADQWATCCFSMAITFPNLVRIHYWYSVIVISAYFEVRSLREIFGDRLYDPLGFKVYK